MPMTPENATWFADAFSTIVNNVGQALLDKEDVIKLALTTMLSEGHLLLEDAPAPARPPWPGPWRPRCRGRTRASSSPPTCCPATSRA